MQRKKQTIENIKQQIKIREKRLDSKLAAEMKRQSTEKEKSRLAQKSELTEKVLSKYFDPKSLSGLGYREILLQGILNRNKDTVKYAIKKGLTRIIDSIPTFEVIDSDVKVSKQLIEDIYFDAILRIENDVFESDNEKRNLIELKNYLYQKF
jgi:hypothetical protein